MRPQKGIVAKQGHPDCSKRKLKSLGNSISFEVVHHRFRYYLLTPCGMLTNCAWTLVIKQPLGLFPLFDKGVNMVGRVIVRTDWSDRTFYTYLFYLKINVSTAPIPLGTFVCYERKVLWRFYFTSKLLGWRYVLDKVLQLGWNKSEHY